MTKTLKTFYIVNLDTDKIILGLHNHTKETATYAFHAYISQKKRLNEKVGHIKLIEGFANFS